MIRRCFSLSMVLGLLAVACGSSEPPQGTKVDFGGARDPASGLQFTAPGEWEVEEPAGQFRRRQYRLPGGDAGDAQVIVFVFPGAGGTTDANIARWIGQFSRPDGSTPEARVTNREAGRYSVTVVDVSGTYTPTMRPGGEATAPLPDQRLVAAVIETGSDPWFVHLVGPRETVARWEPSFYEYVDSVR